MQVRDASRDELVSVLTAAHAVWGRGRALEDFVAFEVATRVVHLLEPVDIHHRDGCLCR